MLQNVVETKSKEVSYLETKMKDLNLNKACEKCENVRETTSDFSDHKGKFHGEEDVPSTSKCGSCDFESVSKNDIDLHMKTNHELKCELCELSFKSDKDLQAHYCRVQISNPTCGDYYTKDWILVNGCTRIFSCSRKSEVLFLHSDQCLNKKRSCPDLPGFYHLTNYDGEYWHAPLTDFFSEGKMRWEALHGDFNIRIR